jgi:hypothetical protein
MKDNEVEDLFAWGWGDTSVAIAVVCVILVIGFVVGYVI